VRYGGKDKVGGGGGEKKEKGGGGGGGGGGGRRGVITHTPPTKYDGKTLRSFESWGERFFSNCILLCQLSASL